MINNILKLIQIIMFVLFFTGGVYLLFGNISIKSKNVKHSRTIIGTISILLSSLIMIILSMFILEEYKVLSHLKPSLKRESIISFSAAMVLLVAFAWFIVGVFPIYPSVILTGSMEPDIYPGDVVIIEKILSEEEVYKLKEGDIINFKIEDITVTHRIEEVILDEAGNLSFITKGDNNDSADKWLVLPNDLKGTVKKVVPKVGLPIVWAHTNENIPEGVIEN